MAERRQLTSVDPQATTGTARWFSDSRQIVFDSNAGGYHVYVVAADGGQPRALTTIVAEFHRLGSRTRIYLTSVVMANSISGAVKPDGSGPEQVRQPLGAPSIS